MAYHRIWCIGGLLILWLSRQASGSAVYGEWEKWSDCSNLRCSSQTRRRDCQESSSDATAKCDSKLKEQTRSCNSNFCFGDDITIAIAVSGAIALVLIVVVAILCIRRRQIQKRNSLAKSSRPNSTQNPAENLYDQTSKKDFALVSTQQNHYNDGFDELSSDPLSNASSLRSFAVSKSFTNTYLPGIDDAASDFSLQTVTINPLSEPFFPDNDYGLDFDSLEPGPGEAIVEEKITFGPENHLSSYFNQTDTIARPGVMKIVTSIETQTDDESVVA